MKQLVLLRGAMGVGKSTWIKENFLDPYTISPDNIRTLFSSPIYFVDGKRGISQKHENKVWDILFSTLEERMSKGDFTIVDATHVKQDSISAYKELCRKYGYRCYVVEFEKDIETILEQNKKRENYKYVPEKVIKNAYARLKDEYVPKWVTKTTPEKFVEDVMWKEKMFTHKYDNIYIIGDIHGCMNPLQEFIDEYGINDNDLYIFVGDYIDRGLQNKEVLSFCIEHMAKENFIFLEGNHERHLRKWVNDEEIASRTFLNKTLPQLIDGGDSIVNKKNVKELIRRLQQCIYFSYGERKYIVSHGGIHNLYNIVNLSFIPTWQLINGVGSYDDDIDLIFHENHKHEPFIQIHGHRNSYRHEFERRGEDGELLQSINLEGQVERGGHLRVCVVDHATINFKQYKNDLFEKSSLVDEDFNKQTEKSLEDFVAIARESKMVNVNKLEDNIESFNFNREAFKKRKWNDLTTLARGLFINTRDMYVAARGYEKFFNDNERKTTEPRFLSENVRFPLIAYKKYNGFLGLMSYDKGTGKVKYYSKSISSNLERAGSPHANWAEETINECVPADALNKMKIISKEQNVTFVFEIIRHKDDPHIIKYENNQVILLDVIKNELIFSKIKYHELQEFSRYENQNFKVKEVDKIFNTWSDYYMWYNSLKNDLSQEIEGWVLEDANCFMWKIKTPYYIEWKKMRSLVSKMTDKRSHLINRSWLYYDWQTSFLHFMLKQDEYLKINPNIVKLRDMWKENIESRDEEYIEEKNE